MKDAKLDVVAWKDFHDKRPGKLIGFGQCATGNDWHNKRTDLQPLDWCRHWMRDVPLVPPQRMFFVPHRIEPDEWSITSTAAGLTFDRCRTSKHASLVDNNAKKQAGLWSAAVLKGLRRR